MSSSASVKLRYEKCLGIWGNAIDEALVLHALTCAYNKWPTNREYYKAIDAIFRGIA